MLVFVLEAIISVVLLAVAVALYRRDRRRGPRVSQWGGLVKLVAVVAVSHAIWQYVAFPLVRGLAPAVAATGTTLGKRGVTPLDHVLFAYVIGVFFAYMLVRPRLLGALGVGEPVESNDDHASGRD